MTLHFKFQNPTYRLFWILMFMMTDLCDVASLIHEFKMFNLLQMMKKVFPYILTKANCFLSEISFYALILLFFHKKKNFILTNVILKIRFFENSYFNKFNLWDSHSIFHVLIVCAAVIQLMNYLNVFNYFHANLICSFFWIMHICWVWRFWLLKRVFKRWLYDNEKNHMIWSLLIMIDICHNYFI